MPHSRQSSVRVPGPGRSASPVPLRSEAYLSKAQEDQAKDRAGVLLRLEAGIGAELIGRVPQALFERSGGSVFLGRGDPVHG